MKRRTGVKIISYTVAAFVVACGFAVRNRHEADKYKKYIEYEQMRAMSELVENMSNISTTLEKGRYVNAPSLMTSILAEIWREASDAKINISELPISNIELDNTNKFISQVGDYAFYLTKKAASNERMTDEELSNLDSLMQTSKLFTESLVQLQSEIYDGTLRFDSVMPESMNSLSASVDASGLASMYLSDVEEEFPEYASLIYDGPLSEHIEKLEPELIKNKSEITIDEARNIAAKFMNVQPGALEYLGTGGDKIKTYSFSESQCNDCYIDICVNGGYVLNMSCSHEETVDTHISGEEAVNIAKSFLEKNGYDSMKESYYDEYAGIITVNFSYTQDDVTVYSDLIKVGVSSASGKIVRFESRGYIMCHKERALKPPVVSSDKAAKKLSGEISYEYSGLALIPTEGQGETLCHEFLCQAEDGTKMIIYCDTETGIEKQIFILVETENGTLTI